MKPLVLPWPPSVNSYWRSIVIGGSPRVLISRAGRQYRVDVQAAVLERFGLLRPTRARLLVAIGAHPPDRRSRDLDNLCKGILDSLTHARVWEDDSQIDGLLIVRREVAAPGRVEVRIERLTDEPAEQRLLSFGGVKRIGGGE